MEQTLDFILFLFFIIVTIFVKDFLFFFVFHVMWHIFLHMEIEIAFLMHFYWNGWRNFDCNLTTFCSLFGKLCFFLYLILLICSWGNFPMQHFANLILWIKLFLQRFKSIYMRMCIRLLSRKSYVKCYCICKPKRERKKKSFFQQKFYILFILWEWGFDLGSVLSAFYNWIYYSFYLFDFL